MAEPIPPKLQQLLQRELTPGERVVWQARPAPASRALLGVPAFLFGIPFTAGALLSLATRLADGPPGADRADPAWVGYLEGGAWIVFGGALVVVGVGLLIAP